MMDVAVSSVKLNNRCGRCEKVMNHLSLLYGCNNNHCYCYHCYKAVRTSACLYPNCNLPIHRMDVMQANILKEQRDIRKMFPEPQRIHEELSKKNSLQKSSISLCRENFPSKKPLTCPHPGCKKLISVSLIDAHFRREHEDVPFIRTYLENRNTIEFDPFCTRYNSNVCVVLIHVHDDKQNNEIQGVSCERNANLNRDDMSKKIRFIMASKIPVRYVNVYGKKILNHVENENKDPNIANDKFVSTDKLLLWVASPVITKLKYTLAASTPYAGIRLKYHGGISYINENSTKLCETGKGLILNYRHVSVITNKGTKPLVLDIILPNMQIEDSN